MHFGIAGQSFLRSDSAACIVVISQPPAPGSYLFSNLERTREFFSSLFYVPQKDNPPEKESRAAGRAHDTPLRLLSSHSAELKPVTHHELDKIPGSIVYICSRSIELLLYLEHKKFELVMVFSEPNPSPDFLAATDFLAEECRGIPVLVTKQPAANPAVLAKHRTRRTRKTPWQN